MTTPDQLDKFPAVATTEALFMKLAAANHHDNVLAKFCNHYGCWKLRHFDLYDLYLSCEEHVTPEEREQFRIEQEHRELYSDDYLGSDSF